MVITVAYLVFIFIELLIAIFFCIYMSLLFYSSLMGSPYVPTRKKAIRDILDRAKLKKGSLFIDLGCGDGRIVREAVSYKQVKGIGVDINPVLIFWARLKTRLAHMKGIEYKVENIYHTDISKADAIYIFLLPQFLRKLRPKLEKEAKKGTLIISHGFTIKDWEPEQMIDAKPFQTFFYRIK
jgi:SAM-dependent methyltransferase